MENKNELIDDLLSNTEITPAGTTNTEKPVLENLFSTEAADTSVPISEIVNKTLKLSKETEDIAATLPEKYAASNMNLPPDATNEAEPSNVAEPPNVTEPPNVAENTTDIAVKPPIETVPPGLDSNLESANETEAPKQTEVPTNTDSEKATENLKVVAEDILETTVEEPCTPEVKIKETKEILEQNIVDEFDNESKEVEKSSKDNENDNPEENKVSELKTSEISNEPIDSQNESPAEINKNKEQLAAENLKDVIEKSSIEATKECEILPTEEIEPMDTCDSQESLNLIIDETSNITENKDDLSDNNKTDEDTNMEVEFKEHRSDVIKESNDKGQDEKEKTEAEEEDALNKLKDDDVIPIEQPPVPIIEIDDEDDIDPTDSIQTSAKESEEKQTPMDVDEKTQTVVSEKEISSTENDKDTSKSENVEAQQTTEENLLEVTSEKPLEEHLGTQESKISEGDDGAEDPTVEIFYNKECINYECPRNHKQYFRVPQFAFSYFQVTKKKFKMQYICADCYDKALEMYEEFCGLISSKQPLLLEEIPCGRQEFVEIIDSSDDENTTNDSDKPAESTKSAFSQNDLSLIESELHNTIKSVLNNLEIQNQLTWSKTILTERLKRLEVETNFIDNELKTLQKKADKMHEGLYSCPKIKIRQLQPLDLNSGKLLTLDHAMQKEIQPIPPVGEIERPIIQVSNIYYAVKNNPIASWVPCRVIEQVEGSILAQKNVKHYKIKFIKNLIQMPKTVPAKYLAYYDPPSVRLPIGTRVIAYFDATSLARGREKINVQSAFYPGIIAEPLKPNNKFRYLIFYDDGYTQYVYHKDVRLVCHVSDCVWEDVHPASRDFIQKYLTQYSINRPMVQTQKGQSMNTESNGYWLHARVVDIDCSLVLMQFEGSKSHTEWIYRGSLRLGPVFKEYQKSLQKNSTVPVSRLPRRTEPFIRYTEDEENTSQQQADKSNDNSRAVARKTFGRPESMMNSASTSQQQQPLPVVKHLNNSTIYVEDENKPKGKVVYYTAKRNLPPRKYKPHFCSPSCLFEITHNLSAYSPLSKPLLSGWERFIIRQKIKRVVTYRAPCGKIMRNMKELHHYLRTTHNILNVDNFDFSHETNCLAEYVIESAIVQKRDISGGQEKMAIPLVNYYDNTLPPECKYSAKVIPTEGVNINTDPAFLVGCDCDDDCIDKNKCACWQLTLAGAKYGNPNAAPEEVGYQYRRLLDHVPTGIYECNINCKCKSSCLNRVVQNSLTMKLQVFKTSNRGWGLRCINDIPRGSFVCVYAGHLLTEAKANEGGQDAGDEYFAELDYIEVAEQIKEGYESEVEIPELEEEDPYNPEGDDDEFTPSKSWMTRAKKQNATKSTRSSNQEEDSQERQVINFNPNADMNEDSGRENSIRKLYGKDEACYVMDAKISGNLGRYFNHSCSPNMFVQNVFVETHDLRFPNVAFFSSCNIRAGTELTWNYNYEVGVVPGKVLYCQCGAPNCRLRLL